MIKPFRRRVIGLVIILFFLLMTVGAISITGFYSEGLLNPLFSGDVEKSVRGESDYKAAGIEDAASKLADRLDKAYEEYYAKLQVGADITAKALYRDVYHNGDEAIVTVGDGFVIKFEEDRVRIPAGVRADVMRAAKRFEGTKGHIEYITYTKDGTRSDTLVYSQIRGPYYYVEIVNGWDTTDYVTMHVNYMRVLEGIEQAFKTNLYVFADDWKNNEHMRFLNEEVVYIGDPSIWETLEEEGYSEITPIRDVYVPKNVQELIEMTPEERLKLNDVFVSTGENATNLRFIVRSMEDLDCTFVMAFAENDTVRRLNEQVTIAIRTFLILGGAFLIWLTSVYKEMFNGTITSAKREKYAPTKVRLITVSYGILSALVLFVVGFYTQSLGSVYQENMALGNNLDALEMRLESLAEEENFRKEKRQELYVEYAERVAALLETYPELNNKADLKEINKAMDSSFIMLFDANGKQVSTSSNYINMELGKEDAEKPSRTADFRRILKGVPSIVHENEMVEEIHRELELYGVRTNDKVNGGYGVLLLAVEADADEESDWQKRVGDTMEVLSPKGKLFFSVNKENYISSANASDLIDTWLEDVTDKDIETIRTSGLNDFIKIRAITHYGVAKVFEQDGEVYFACTPNALLFANGMRMSLIGMIGYILMFFVLAAYLLHGYTEKSILIAMDRMGKEEVTRKPSTYARIKAEILNRLDCKTPDKKARLVVFLSVMFLLLDQVTDMIFGAGNGAQNYVFSYIMSGQWGRGINLFAFTAAGILFVSITILMLVIRFILNTVAAMLNPRGKTICRLIANMFHYMGILVFLYFALSYIGVDTNAILASVGVLGIGLSMGARDIIADVLAGVSTIMEGEYKVGDIVDIDGYRGMVQEIGVRSTKVIGRGGNIKIVSNKDIKNVTNLTKMNSWVTITIRVDVAYPLTQAEDLLKQALPHIGKSHKEIISGPYYEGVRAVDTGLAVLSITAECKEDNYHKVERILNREILLVLRSNNVPVR